MCQFPAGGHIVRKNSLRDDGSGLVASPHFAFMKTAAEVAAAAAAEDDAEHGETTEVACGGVVANDANDEEEDEEEGGGGDVDTSSISVTLLDTTIGKMIVGVLVMLLVNSFIQPIDTSRDARCARPPRARAREPLLAVLNQDYLMCVP